MLLREVVERYECIELHVSFSSSSKSQQLNGLFTLDNLVGMLETSHFRQIKKVLPFSGSIYDRDSVSRPGLLMTTVSTKYCEILSCVYRHGRFEWWEKQEFEMLRSRILSFKKLAKFLFGSIHATSLGTEKFCMVDNLT